MDNINGNNKKVVVDDFGDLTNVTISSKPRESFDASWKIYHDYKKPSNDKTLKIFMNKISTAATLDYNFYGKNIKNMINYIYTLFKSISKIVDSTDNNFVNDVVTNISKLDNFMICYVMLGLKEMLEKVNIYVIMIPYEKCSLLVNDEIELYYDMQHNNVIVRPKFTDIKMFLSIEDTYNLLIDYFAKKKDLGNGYIYPKKND